jgi:hypothetical protein
MSFCKSLNKYDTVLREPEESPAQESDKNSFGDSFISGFPAKALYALFTIVFLSLSPPPLVFSSLSSLRISILAVSIQNQFLNV